MVKRWISGILGAFAVLNGAYMLMNGSGWYGSVPGVVDTGPYNSHFILDIGAAFIISGLGLGARAWRSRYWPAGLAGAGFFGAHALIHVIEIVAGHSHHVGLELVSIVAPSALAIWAAAPAKGEAHV